MLPEGISHEGDSSKKDAGAAGSPSSIGRIKLVRAELKIRCPNCKREEEFVRVFDNRVVDFNVDKLCPACGGVWMTDKQLTMIETP